MWVYLLSSVFLRCYRYLMVVFFFFFNDTATTEIYTLSLHDALPILADVVRDDRVLHDRPGRGAGGVDRKSTRLNSSHANISYAVFCLKKKNTTNIRRSVVGNQNMLTPRAGTSPLP